MNSSTAMIFAVLCLAIGYIAGLLVSSLLGNRSKPESETGKPDGNKGLPILPNNPPSALDAADSQPKPNGDQQITRLDQVLFWRDRPEAPFQIDVDGVSLSKGSNLTAFQQKRLAALLPEIQSWLDKPVINSKVESAKENMSVGNGMPGLKLGLLKLELNPKPVLPQAPKSIVTQIDDILQAQIKGTKLADLGIRLTEAPGESVVVWIGLEHFEGINSVPDAEVLAAIRHAVQTWEVNA